MFLAIIPILVLVIGLLLYALATNGKVAEMGRIMFFCGMIVVTYALSSHLVVLLK